MDEISSRLARNIYWVIHSGKKSTFFKFYISCLALLYECVQMFNFVEFCEFAVCGSGVRAHTNSLSNVNLSYYSWSLVGKENNSRLVLHLFENKGKQTLLFSFIQTLELKMH